MLSAKSDLGILKGLCVLQLVFFLICAFQEAGQHLSLSFGERQVFQMLDDRPEMQGLFNEESALFQWLVCKFQGEKVESRVYWNAEEPASGFSAEHARRYLSHPAYVRVTSRMSGLDMWVALVFELNNLQNAAAFDELDMDAIDGRVSRNQFIEKYVRLEVDSMIETERVLREKVDKGVLDMSGMYAIYLDAAMQRREGKEYDTGIKHREYYRTAYDRLRSFARKK